MSQRVHYHIQVNASQISPRSTPSKLLKESSTSSTLPENHPSVAELHPGHQRCQRFIRIRRRTSSRTSTLPEIHPHPSPNFTQDINAAIESSIRRRTSPRTSTSSRHSRLSKNLHAITKVPSLLFILHYLKWPQKASIRL